MGKKKCDEKSKCCSVEAKCCEEAKCDATACDLITFTDEELVALRDLDRKLGDLRGGIADLYEQKFALEEGLKKVDEKLNETLTSLRSTKESYLAEAKRLAKEHGVDMDLPNQGNWTLYLADKTLVKQKEEVKG